MSNVNKQFKELINEAIDNGYHNNIEMKIILKEWLQGMFSQATKAREYEAKSKAFDKYLETQQRKLDQIKRKVHTNDNFTYKDVSAFIAYNDTINELESYRK